MDSILSKYAKIMDKIFEAYKNNENGLNELEIYRKMTHMDEFTRKKVGLEIDDQTEELRAQIDNWEHNNTAFHIYLYTLLENLYEEHEKSIKDAAILSAMIQECYNSSEQKTLSIYLTATKQALSEIGVSSSDIEKGFALGVDKVYGIMMKTEIEVIDGNIIKFPSQDE